MSTEVAEHYEATRERLIALARELDDDDAATPVPTCPGWTVFDVYAHLTGLCADVLVGRLEGVATDPWTAIQVEARRGRPFNDVIDEWEADGPPFEAAMRSFGDKADPRVVIDALTHEQDVRGSLGRPGGREVAAVGFAVSRMVPGFGRGWEGRGLAPVRIIGSSGSWVLGEGDPVATMQAPDIELLRVLVGRRSRAQALALWDGDGEPFVDHLVAFSFAERDIIE
ncbi:MAG: maleylpyruvate isomerase family mycothiol-dependent enzyme [Acidimicrobiales bacterium]